MRHVGHLRQAETFAFGSRYKRWRVGAVVVRGGRVLAGASNDLRNSADMDGVPWSKCSVHAEIAAIKKVKRSKAEGATVYVARVLKNGQRGLARPCERCEGALIAANIRRAIWTIDDESYGVTVFRGADFPG